MRILSPYDIQKYTQIFNKIDEDCKEYLTKEQFVNKLHLFIQVPQQQLKEFFDLLDFDKSNSLELNEFLHFFFLILNAPYASDNEVYFRLADADQNNSVDREEFRQIVQRMKLKDDKVDIVFDVFSRDEVLNIQNFEDAIKLIEN